MKKFKKSIAAIAAIALTLSMTACNKEQQPVANTQPAANTQLTTMPPATEPTITTPTEPPEDLTSVPNLDVFSKDVYNSLINMTGFEMTCTTKGFIPNENYFTTNEGRMIEHSFTLTANNAKTHLASSTKDLNTGETTTYEEYQVLEDGIVTTFTQYDNKWVDNTPKDFIRYSMLAKSYASLPIFGIFADSETAGFDTFSNCSSLARGENGEYIFTVKGWDIVNYESDFGKHGFSGLFRSSSMGDVLANTTLDSKNGDCVYTFDKNLIPISISFDIFNTDNYNAEFYGLDLHGEVKFSKWNAINDIALPKISSAETEADTSVPETLPSETESPITNDPPAAVTTAPATNATPEIATGPTMDAAAVNTPVAE